MTPAPAGERYNEVKGYYFERRQATFAGMIGTRARAGRRYRQRRRQGRWPAAGVPLPDQARRRAADAAGQEARPRRRGRGLHGQVAERHRRLRHRAALPREHDVALEAAGYEVETFDIDAPPANGGSPNPVPTPATKYPTNLGVLSHFDAVNYYSGDDFAPQETTRRPSPADRRPRRPATKEMAPWAHKVMLELREYANTGGKLLVDGRNVHQPFTSTERQPDRDRSVDLDAGQAVRVLLPAEQRGRRRSARHRLAAFA